MIIPFHGRERAQDVLLRIQAVLQPAIRLDDHRLDAVQTLRLIGNDDRNALDRDRGFERGDERDLLPKLVRGPGILQLDSSLSLSGARVK